MDIGNDDFSGSNVTHILQRLTFLTHSLRRSYCKIGQFGITLESGHLLAWRGLETMNLKIANRQAALSWLMVGVLFVLCAVLGVLQYRWIAEVSVAAQERMQRSLQGSLSRLSQDFNQEVATSMRGLVPASTPRDARMAESEVSSTGWVPVNRHCGSCRINLQHGSHTCRISLSYAFNRVTHR